MKDYYKILEVEENATDDQIKKSYRNLSKKYHPDVNPEGSEKFKEIAEAYEILGDKVKRDQYNQRKNNPFQNSPLQDMFEQMFGSNMGQGFNQQRRKQAPDKILKLTISPVESYIGVEKVIRYSRESSCNVCGGFGGQQQGCNTCHGAGYQVKSFGSGFLVQQIRTTCPTCGGKGYTLVHKCNGCQGNGSLGEHVEIKIKIPVGCDNGQYLRVNGKGDSKNGEYGDLVIQIELQPLDGFEKINNDLIYNLFLDLNGINQPKYLIPHPDGDLNVDAPKIIDTSRPLRLRGKGYHGGDMYIKLNLKYERPI
jgi:molecular chaperone DnaJ